jgi:hypothetical protein
MGVVKIGGAGAYDGGRGHEKRLIHTNDSLIQSNSSAHPSHPGGIRAHQCSSVVPWFVPGSPVHNLSADALIGENLE